MQTWSRRHVCIPSIFTIRQYSIVMWCWSFGVVIVCCLDKKNYLTDLNASCGNLTIINVLHYSQYCFTLWTNLSHFERRYLYVTDSITVSSTAKFRNSILNVSCTCLANQYRNLTYLLFWNTEKRITTGLQCTKNRDHETSSVPTNTNRIPGLVQFCTIVFHGHGTPSDVRFQ